jgi:nitroreductase
MGLLNNEVWEVPEQDFPETAAIETQLRFLLRFAVLAPSPKNSQPWAFALRGNQLHLMADLGRSQPVSDPDRRELYISVGCALENLLVAAEHFGFHPAVSYFPQRWHPELAATVLFQRGGKVSPARAGATLDAILHRRNDTGVFRSTPVSEELRRRLEACCVEPELGLDLSDDHLFRHWIDALTLESDRIDFANPAFRIELGYWVSQGAFGSSPLKSQIGRHAASRIDLGKAVALQDHVKVESAALLGLIRATGDSHLAHVRTGQLFERVWLTATALGVSVNPMSQTMRRPELRSAVAELIPSPGWTPQHVFRVGYSSSDTEQRTPRRPVDDVML